MHQLFLKGIFFSLFFSFLSITVVAQEEPDITGLWKGQLYNDTTQEYLPYELAISMEKGKLVGYSYTAFKIDSNYEVGIKELNIMRKKGKILIEDDKLLSNTYTVKPPKGVKQRSILTLSTEGKNMVLSGLWSTNRTKEYRPLTGTMKVQRRNDFYKSEIAKSLDTLKLIETLSFVDPTTKKDKPAVTQQPVAAVTTIQKPVEKSKEEIKQQAQAARDSIKKEQQAAKEKEQLAQQELKKAKEEEKRIAIEKAREEKEKEQLAKIEAKKEKEEAKRIAIEKSKADALAAAKAAEALAIAKANAGPAAEVSTRKTVTTQTVYYESDSLTFSLYDNGDIDGDTVTVLMNKDVLFSKQGLTANANSKTVHFDNNTPDSIHLVMYAENLGKYPPNTGLLIMYDGPTRYEVRFSADLQTNAEIILQRKKKPGK